MKILAFMGMISFPLALINMFGGIISGIWLAVLGEWNAILWGFIALLSSHFLLGFALMPAMLFAAPAAYFAERFKPLFYVFGLLGALYTVAIITIWCAYVFNVFVLKADSFSSAIPLLLWSYGVATGPLAYMASKEGPDNLGSLAVTMFAQLGYVVMILLALLSSANISQVIVVFGLIMLIGMFLQFSMALVFQRAAATA